MSTPDLMPALPASTSAIAATAEPAPLDDALQSLLHARSVSPRPPALPGLVMGELIGLADNGLAPLLLYPGQPGSAAVRGRSLVDLHGQHIGKSVALLFEDNDPARPLVMGVVQQADNRPEALAAVDVEADGERLLVSSKEQLVLRCGKASITLTKSGKVLIEGTYISSRSGGVTRIKGASLQLN